MHRFYRFRTPARRCVAAHTVSIGVSPFLCIVHATFLFRGHLTCATCALVCGTARLSLSYSCFYVYYQVDDDEVPTALRLVDVGGEDEGAWLLLESATAAEEAAPAAE